MITKYSQSFHKPVTDKKVKLSRNIILFKCFVPHFYILNACLKGTDSKELQFFVVNVIRVRKSKGRFILYFDVVFSELYYFFISRQHIYFSV